LSASGSFPTGAFPAGAEARQDEEIAAMSDKSRWNRERIALSVRVGALVAVLGFVVLAAEHRLAQDISPQEILTAEVLPGFEVSTPADAQPQAAPAQTAVPESEDFGPPAAAAPAAEREEQPATF
jgi:hypothetical protein